MNSEMKSRKWLWGGIGLQLGIGYTVGFVVYQVGTVITTGTVGAGFLPGLVAVLAMAAIVAWRIAAANRKLKLELSIA